MVAEWWDVSSNPTIAEMMVAYAQDAVDHARRNGVMLDYTAESVKDVERLLEMLWSAVPRGILARLFKKERSEEDIATVAKMYGGYVGEVIRRTRGGEWVVDTEISPGQTVISLREGEWRIFPPARVHNRLVNGPEDNVWHYFQALMSER